jgi:hypothetical protein
MKRVTQQTFPGVGRLQQYSLFSPSFSLSVLRLALILCFNKQKLPFYFKELFVHFLENEKCRPYPVIEAPGIFIAW